MCWHSAAEATSSSCIFVVECLNTLNSPHGLFCWMRPCCWFCQTASHFFTCRLTSSELLDHWIGTVGNSFTRSIFTHGNISVQGYHAINLPVLECWADTARVPAKRPCISSIRGLISCKRSCAHETGQKKEMTRRALGAPEILRLIIRDNVSGLDNLLKHWIRKKPSRWIWLISWM